MSRLCRRNLKAMARKLQTHPALRKQFNDLKRDYKKLCKHKAQMLTNNMLEELEKLDENNDNRGFWNKLKKINDESNPSDISDDEWSKHFEKICNSPGSKDSLANLPDPVDLFEESKVILDYDISLIEISNAIKKLSNGKASGPDNISNEMLKYGAPVLTPILHKIFNDILVKGIYPQAWTKSYLITIFKSGNTDDTNDYRGISLSSNVAKLFSAILNNRLCQYLEDRISIYQAGFRKDFRTTDHIFTLNALIKKYLKRKKGKKKLYACFVDFSKAFDSLWRPYILQKLFDKGVGGKFYNIVKNMMSCTEARMRTSKTVTQYFAMTLGIKQGDTLSPTLFNVFIDDLATKISNINTHPPELNGVPIPILLYADDVILISEDPMALQTCLDGLQDYCQEWKMKVNLDKTKIMVFENRKSLSRTFLLGDMVVPKTDRYKYLGVHFSYTGNFNIAQQELYKKALKALFSVNSKTNLYQIKPNLAIKLFNTLVKPIALYGCEIWGMDLLKLLKGDFNLLDRTFSEKLQNKFCKMALGVGKRSINCAVRNELCVLPMCLTIFKRILDYNHRLADLPDDRIAYNAYIDDRNANDHGFSNNKSRMNNIKTWYDSVMVLQNSTHQQDDESIIKVIRENYLKKVNEYINSSSRLKFYSKICKVNYESCQIPSYHFIKNLNIRRAITKFRISAHKYACLTSKFKNPRVEGDDKCKLCNEIESEEHVLFHCLKYDRVKLYAKIEEKYEKFSEKSEPEKIAIIKNILYSKDTKLIEELGFFLKITHDKEEVNNHSSDS